MNGIEMDRRTEALIILAEECCEVGQMVSKILRWGIDSTNQGQLDATNRDQLVKELGDLMAMIRIVQGELDISDMEIAAAVQNKLDKLKKWSRHF